MKSPSAAKIFNVLGPAGFDLMIERLADLCGDHEDRRQILLLGLKEEQDQLLLALKKEFPSIDDTRFLHIESEQYRSAIPGLEHLSPVELPASLASSVVANQIVDTYYKGRKDNDGKYLTRPREITAVVSLYQNPENRERYLETVSKLPIEIFFVDLTAVNEDGDLAEGMFPREGSVTSLFDTVEEFRNLPELTWVIDGIAQEGEITVVGGLAKHGKTWFLLAIVKALLTGEPLFGHFNLPCLSERVVYLIPETARRSFYSRLKLMRIDQFLGDRLFVRTLSKGPAPMLDDPTLLAAVKDADVFLDTVVRFIAGEENAASDIKNFSAQLFGLQSAGARSVWGAHHSPKAFGEATTMTLENMLRGSGDLGAMLSNAYGLRQLDERTNLVHVQALAGRDLPELVLPFQIQGRPHIVETGDFKLVKKPGEAGVLSDHVGKKAGRPEDPVKEEKLQLILDLNRQGKSRKEIAERVGIPKTTITRWLTENEREEGRPEF